MTNEEKARGKIEQRLAVLNPSDEKLRETITEKDAEIARLKLPAIAEYEKTMNANAKTAWKIKEAHDKAIAEKDAEIQRLKFDRDNWKERAIENNWPFEWQVASEFAAENRKLRKEIQELKASDWAGVTETLTKRLIEKDAEIARLEEINANNWAEYRSKANHPASIKEAIASIDSGPGWVTSITISRTEWFRLLTAIEEIEKDAERYRRLKAQRGAIHIYLEPMTQLSLEMPSHLFQPDNVDSAIDALPEVKK